MSLASCSASGKGFECPPVHDWQKDWSIREAILHRRRKQSTAYSDFMRFGQDGAWRSEEGPWGYWEAKARACPVSFDRHGLESLQLKPCPGKGSDHSATEWRSKSFPDSFSVFFNKLVYVLLWQEGSGLRMPVWHQHPSKACLCADREGFRETPPLKARFLLCSCAGQGLGLRNSALDSLCRGAALLTWLRPLCHTIMWSHKAFRDCLGWS